MLVVSMTFKDYYTNYIYVKEHNFVNEWGWFVDTDIETNIQINKNKRRKNLKTYYETTTDLRYNKSIKSLQDLLDFHEENNESTNNEAETIYANALSLFGIIFYYYFTYLC